MHTSQLSFADLKFQKELVHLIHSLQSSCQIMVIIMTSRNRTS